MPSSAPPFIERPSRIEARLLQVHLARVTRGASLTRTIEAALEGDIEAADALRDEWRLYVEGLTAYAHAPVNLQVILLNVFPPKRADPEDPIRFRREDEPWVEWAMERLQHTRYELSLTDAEWCAVFRPGTPDKVPPSGYRQVMLIQQARYLPDIARHLLNLDRLA